MTTEDSTPNTAPHESEAASQRRAYIAGLRQLASFLESHPTLPCPMASHQSAYVFTKAQLVAIARTAGVRWKKSASEGYYTLSVPFDGDHAYDVFTDRAEVCTKVVTGTRLVPAQPEHVEETYVWECQSLLDEAAS